MKGITMSTDTETVNPESLDTMPLTDSRGRPDVSTMNDTELLCELVIGQRNIMDAIEAAMDNPMLRMMIPPGMI